MFRDVVIVDGNNVVAGVYNLIEHTLVNPEHYAELRQLLIDIALVPGDVNLDGATNLLDVQPFVNLLSTGKFQIQADINGDGILNLLDVNPFVDLLIGK
jgi:hypothetical protein